MRLCILSGLDGERGRAPGPDLHMGPGFFTMNRPDNCAWPRCRHVDVCCLVPHPNDPSNLFPMCEEHFCKWHETQGDNRAVLVLKLFGKPMRIAKPKPQGG